MSNEVLPRLPGQTLKQGRAPRWKNDVRETGSGRNFARARWTTGKRDIRLEYEFLRAGAEAELQQLEAFFNRHKGNADTWLFDDEFDRTVAAEPFGVGNGTRTAFQLLRSRGGFVEPVYALNGSPIITLTDWRGQSPQSAFARTNLLARSQELDLSAKWVPTGATVTADAASAPDGTITADLITGTAGGNDFITQAPTIASAVPFAVSVYVKNNDAVRSRIMVRTSLTALEVVINWTGATLSSLTLNTGASASFEALPGGWYRVIGHATTTQVNQGVRLYGTADTDTKSAYMWGAQLEVGSVATPYISTVAAPVTVTDYALSQSGMVTFAVPPTVAATLTWSGDYYWRCRFKRSDIEFEQFLYELWSLKQLEFTTEKP